MYLKKVAIPANVLEDITTPEVKQFIITELTDAHNTRCELEKAKTTISEQNTYIAELEKQVSLLQKTLEVIQQNKCKVKKVKPVHKKNKRIEKIELIVRENNDSPYGFPSTVGVKCYINSKHDNLHIGFGKPELTVAEVVDTANMLIKDLLRRCNSGRF